MNAPPKVRFASDSPLEEGVSSEPIAGYPLVTLLLSRAFLEKEDVGPQLIAGVTGAVCGVVLLLVA